MNFARSIDSATFVVVKQQLFCLTESKCVSCFQAIANKNLILDKISSSSPQHVDVSKSVKLKFLAFINVRAKLEVAIIINRSRREKKRDAKLNTHCNSDSENLIPI